MPSPNRGNFPNNNAYEKARANYERKGKRPASASASLENVLYETNMLRQMNISNLEALMKVSPKLRNLVRPIIRNKIRKAKTLMKERTAATLARRGPLVAQLRTNYRGQTLSNNNKKFLMNTNYASIRRAAYRKGLQPKPPMGLAPAPTIYVSQHPFRGYMNHMRNIRPYERAWMFTANQPGRNNRYRSTGRLTAEAKRYHRSNADIARERQLMAQRIATRWLKKFRARKNLK
jgi:hypothetical protein